MILHSDWSYIEQEFECGLRDRFLMPVRSLDNAKSVTPFILEIDGRRSALFMHVEHGNAKAAYLPPAFDQIFYRPYFTFEPDLHGPVHATLVDTIRDLANGARDLRLDAKLPVTVADDLAKAFDVSYETTPDIGPVTLRRAAASETSARLAAQRSAAGLAARALLDRSPMRDRILPYIDTAEPDRFARLDLLLAAPRIDALVLTTRLNIQEVAGVPMRAKHAPLAALYRPGGEIWVIEAGTRAEGKTYSSLRAALSEICPHGRVACEKDDIGCAMFANFGLGSRETFAADDLLRRWRDHGTLPDLAFYIIATRASACAMDAALSFADQAVTKNHAITELDAYKVYFKTLHAFVSETSPELRVGKTLTNFHSGARTVFPANAVAAPLSKAANMLKLDTGCLLFDRCGNLLGCSDIARTLPFSDAGKEMYALFQRGVRNVLIPACKSGASGADIHAAGVNAIWNKHTKPKSNPLFINLADPIAGYDRDVGHLLGKNNLAHLTFTSRTQDRTSEGMIACCEYQWPIAAHAIAYEDTCLVTPSGGLNLTSDEA